MNKFYDKILFLLALIVLGLGAAFFFQQGGVPHVTIPPEKPGNAVFAAKPLPPPPAAPPLWGPAPDEYPPRKEWIYSVFTPPIIWWDGQKFVAFGGGSGPIPFGLALTGIKKNYYRLEFVGFSGTPAAPLINLHDDERNVDYQVPQGAKVTYPGADVTVGKMTTTTVDDPTLGPIKVNSVTVTDERMHKDITLTAGTPLPMDDLTFLRLVTLEPYPEKEWIVSKVGDELDVSDVNFQIKEFSINPLQATVIKKYKNIQVDPANPNDTNEDTQVLEKTTPPPRRAASNDDSPSPPPSDAPATDAAPATPTP